ncbi:MAG: TraR/DksA C4-type zinc finger protein [Haliscomenobacter sp.]|uniref:TraR/DksA family transcriptional regulator n=1 Tax=Haliscomenobacter sp. TaxID=2717303 RepID=UPI0029B3508E|nr:TraR/DksA C4-type zinc finger protein [Haliscomenobacter sp.]MDX2067207.1 TraR/DksA C4-type zinc finger protein [Haliscomenobacter sp.]
MENEVVRYSDAELDEFKVLIETKLERASTHLSGLQEQILEITENTSDEHGGDWVDDSSINNDVEMLNNMAIRQRMYIQDLENALVRIKNKTYGICSITGQLIDKRRLLAVPTTTKSLAAKVAEQVPAPEKKERVEIEKPVVEKKPVEKKPVEKRITTTIIRKSSSAGKKKSVDIEDLEDEDDELGIGKDMFFDDDQDILYGAVSDLEDDLEDTSSSGTDDDDDDLLGGIGMGGADDGSDDDDGDDY